MSCRSFERWLERWLLISTILMEQEFLVKTEKMMSCRNQSNLAIRNKGILRSIKLQKKTNL